MRRKILISAGEASGDYYASELVAAVRRAGHEAEFFGTTGPRLRDQGVRTIVDAASLAVVGLVEVLAHIPRIYGEFRRLTNAIYREKPDLAILVDSPDFHLRLARKLKKAGVPVLYLIAPQVWAWRKGRLPQLQRNIDRLLCIFPFEEQFFREHQVPAEFVGHPLSGRIQPRFSRQEFFRRTGLDPERELVTLLPGSRGGELRRHLPALAAAVERIRQNRAVQFLLALPRGGFSDRLGEAERQLVERTGIHICEGESWDALRWADVALAASGTVTVEGALLGTPMVTYYRVTPLSWAMGRLLVDIPFYTMVNLIAGSRVVPELMQNEMTPDALARETLRLLDNREANEQMRQGLKTVAARLQTDRDPMDRAAEIAWQYLERVDR